MKSSSVLLNRTIRSMRALWLVIGTSFHRAPWRTVAAFTVYPMSYLEPPVIGLALKLLADACATGNSTMAMVGAVGMVAALGLFNILNLTAWQISLSLEGKVGLALDRRILELASGISGLEHFERPEYLDRLEVLREQGWMLGRAMYAMPMQLAHLIRAVAVSALLAGLHPALLLLPLFAIPSALAGSRGDVRMRKAEEETAPDLRRSRHIYELCVQPRAGKEVRVFRLRTWLRQMHRTVWLRITSKLDAARWRITRTSALGSLIFAAGFAGSIALVGWRVLAGLGGIGDIVLVLAVGSQVSREVLATSWVVAWVRRTARLAEHLVWLEDERRRSYASFAHCEAPNELRRGIRFENVSFRYPGTDRMVLSGVNLEIPAGTTVAVVGKNGAGKTTLVKLLCRFYEPTEGRILVDGTELCAIDRETWLGCISAAFQDFTHFELLLRESVGIGDIGRMHDPEAVEKALERAQCADIVDSLSRGLETQLGSLWQDGQELSEGQWQKLALARAAMRDEPIVRILDEPTASLDPESEHAVFNRHAALASQHTNGGVTLLVTHRFSTARAARLVVVLDRGRIVEQGTHEQLMALGGLYAQLVRIQQRAFFDR